jgi:hypothetical protein
MARRRSTEWIIKAANAICLKEFFVLLEIKGSAGMMTGSAISSLITSGKLLPSYFPHVRSRIVSVNGFASFSRFERFCDA